MTDRALINSQAYKSIIFQKKERERKHIERMRVGTECRFGVEEDGGAQHSAQGSATDFCGQVGPGIGQLACGQPLYPQRCVGRASPATVLTPSPTYSASTAGRRVHGCPPADPDAPRVLRAFRHIPPDYLLPPPSSPPCAWGRSHEIRRVVLTVIDRGASRILDLYTLS